MAPPMPRPTPLLTAIVIAFDVVALATAAARLDRKSSAQREVIAARTVPEYRILVLNPLGSAHSAMPCFQAQGADSVEHAALGAPTKASCQVKRPEIRPPDDHGPMRSYGRW